MSEQGDKNTADLNTLDPGPEPETPEYEEGAQYTYEGGEFVPFEPPQPMRHNESSGRFNKRPTDDIDALEADLDRQVGKPSRWRPDWDLG